MARTFGWVGGVSALALCFGCERAAPPASVHSVVIQAETPERAPLAGVELIRAGRVVGKTPAAGKLSLRLEGSEGERFELSAHCPESYVPERQTLQITLRRLVGSQKLPTYRVVCEPQTRTSVVAVRATNGPDLPVMYLGREVARTDPSGVAHVALTLRPGQRYELGLDTGDKQLLPKNPRAVFVAGKEDELVFFDQRFQKRRTAGGGARRRLPTAF